MAKKLLSPNAFEYARLQTARSATIFPLQNSLRARAPWMTLDSSAEALVQAVFCALFANSALLVVLQDFDDASCSIAIDSIVQMLVNVFEVAVGFIRCGASTSVEQIRERWSDLGKTDPKGRRERRFGQILCLDGIELMSKESQLEISENLFDCEQVLSPPRCTIPSALSVVAFVRSREHSLEHFLREQFLMNVRISAPCPNFPTTQLAIGGAITFSFNQELFDELLSEYENVFVSRDVLSYMGSIIVALRGDRSVVGGLTSKASTALEAVIRGVAALAGQKYAIPTHVQSVAVSVLSHRMEVFAEGSVVPGDIVDQALASVHPPK